MASTYKLAIVRNMECLEQKADCYQHLNIKKVLLSNHLSCVFDFTSPSAYNPYFPLILLSYSPLIQQLFENSTQFQFYAAIRNIPRNTGQEIVSSVAKTPSFHPIINCIQILLWHCKVKNTV